ALSERLQTLAASRFALLIAPLAPHLAEEMWHQLGATGLAAAQPWPTWDPAALAVDQIEIAIQISGKVRERMMVVVAEAEESVKKRALTEERIKALINGKQIKKVVYVKGKLLNIVAV